MPLAPTQLQAAKEVQGFSHCSSTEKIQTRTATGTCKRARRDLQALLLQMLCLCPGRTRKYTPATQDQAPRGRHSSGGSDREHLTAVLRVLLLSVLGRVTLVVTASFSHTHGNNVVPRSGQRASCGCPLLSLQQVAKPSKASTHHVRHQHMTAPACVHLATHTPNSPEPSAPTAPMYKYNAPIGTAAAYGNLATWEHPSRVPPDLSAGRNACTNPACAGYPHRNEAICVYTHPNSESGSASLRWASNSSALACPLPWCPHHPSLAADISVAPPKPHQT